MMKQQNATETAASKLPVFNQTISIEVDVDSIHQKLMETFPEDYKHKEILSHAIVGSAMEHGGIGFIYNAMNGYTNDVDFKVGELVNCTSQVKREYIPSTPETKANRIMKEVGNCEIVDINLYKTDKLCVKFMQHNYEGQSEEVTRWVNHKTCTKLVGVAIVHNYAI